MVIHSNNVLPQKVYMNDAPRFTSVGCFTTQFTSPKRFSTTYGPKYFAWSGLPICGNSTKTRSPSAYEIGLAFLSYQNFERFLAFCSFGFTMSIEVLNLSLESRP